MKRWMVVGLLSLLASLIHIQVLTSSWGKRAEPWTIDLWFNIRGAVVPPEEVALISMDESSYSILEVPMDQAWPRALHARLINRLADIGVKRVVMDILFLGPSSNPEADQALARAIARVPTILGADSGVREQGTAGGRYMMEELLEPDELFSSKAEAVALVRMPDDFGYVRRFEVARSQITKDIPTLNEAAAQIKPGAAGLPGDRDFLWYYGPPATIPTFPYHQVLNDEKFPENGLKDKVVFVGLNLRTELGPAQKDSYITPFYDRGSMFGVEIQATAAANLLSKQWITRSSAWSEGILLFFVTFVMTGLLFSVRPQWAGLLLLVFSLVWSVTSYIAFLNGFFLPGFILVCLVLPISYLGSTLVYYLVTHRSQQQVEKAFQFYLSPEMAKEMRSNPSGLKLGGESVYATAMFTDIAGFTQVTESMNATEVSGMLNAYFSEVMDVVFENKGTLIKFIGDAVFVIWGAPIKVPDHARLAGQTAITIQREVRKFNDSKRFPPLLTRIGIHTGPMVVGNLGSARRFDYTAIGDSVNLAARLEGINKYFGSSIIVSDSCLKDLGSGFSVLKLGTICVAGKKERIGIHLLAETPFPTSIEERWLKALNDFRNRRFENAREHFVQVAEMEEGLRKAAELYLEEIAMNLTTAPDDEWQGEVVFDRK